MARVSIRSDVCGPRDNPRQVIAVLVDGVTRGVAYLDRFLQGYRPGPARAHGGLVGDGPGRSEARPAEPLEVSLEAEAAAVAVLDRDSALTAAALQVRLVEEGSNCPCGPSSGRVLRR